jgi:predicted Fe-Mo cluster-binding NifX family protein
MDEEEAMLAIPVFRARVAPVLDWCSKIILIPEEEAHAASGRQIDVTEQNTFGLMRTLREQGTKTLICGALSPEMLNYGEGIGLRIIHGIAGDIEEVLQAYRERKLDRPRYWIPGCRGQRRYKGGARCSGKGKDEIKSGTQPGGPGTGPVRKGRGGLTWENAPGGPGGSCVCPECGSRKQHERGIPCSQVLCAACNSPMTRE